MEDHQILKEEPPVDRTAESTTPPIAAVTPVDQKQPPLITVADNLQPPAPPVTVTADAAAIGARRVAAGAGAGGGGAGTIGSGGSGGTNASKQSSSVTVHKTWRERVHNWWKTFSSGGAATVQLLLPPVPPQTLRERLHDWWETLTDLCRRGIDKLIFVSFYILLTATIMYAVWNILLTIYEAYIKSHNDETLILKTSEHIFLYLLPVFIVFGFFHYYKNNSRVSLLDGTIDSNDNGNSTNTMNLTKILFISSIISYILIKVIETIFFTGKLDDNNVNKLIASGILLLLLMSYFIFLDRNKHN